MPILDENTIEFISRSPEQTRRVGIRMGSLLKTGDVVCLSGQLGAGKTTMVQGIAQGWGSPDQVTSPTFVIVNNYQRPDGSVLSHLDAYRLTDAAEAFDLDIDYHIEMGPLIIEWPENILPAIPSQNIWVKMEFMGELQRNLLITTNDSKFFNMIKRLRTILFSGVA